jgi:hypothetical protein
VFSVQICFTGCGLEETLEQISAITCINSLHFLLDLIYCCHSILFSVANHLLDRSKYQFLFLICFAGNFCVKTEISVTYLVFLQHFQQAFACCFLQVSDRSEGTCCPKTPRRLPNTLLLGWVTLFSFSPSNF